MTILFVMNDIQATLDRQGSKTPLTTLIQHKCKDTHEQNCYKQLIHKSPFCILGGQKKSYFIL